METPPLTPDQLQHEILTLDPERMTVVVLIGENGTGKSTFLASLARHLTERTPTAAVPPASMVGPVMRGPVVAVANTPHDKFPVDTTAIRYLGQRDGSPYASAAIKGAFRHVANKVTGRVRKLADVLRLMGYEQTIGLAFPDFNPLIGADGATPLPDEELTNLLQRLRTTVTTTLAETTTPVIWINLDRHDESRTGASLVPRLLAKEVALIESGAASGIRVVLRKAVAGAAPPGREIDLQAASSGEITYLASMAWVSAEVTERSILLIDEPENSLHPKWQLRYIEHLHQLFSYEHPLVVIASHSPLLLSGPLPAGLDVLAYRMTDGAEARRIVDLDEVGLEGVSWEAFGVLPGHNQFLSGLLIDLVNRYCRQEISNDEVTATMNTLLKASTDPRQKLVIETFLAALPMAKR